MEIKKAIANFKAKNDRHEIVTNKEKDLQVVYEVALEMYARGYKLENISLNKSLASQFVIGERSIVPPFTSIDGLGDAAANSVIEARKERAFSSQMDLMQRTKISKTHFKVLKDMDVLNSLPEDDDVSLFS
ncbi:hypothetical protein FACS1894218_0450 [Bacilli bacterium]|nr:hypothetical protein FACS1894218_0450 [Bacilli bacterium]